MDRPNEAPASAEGAQSPNTRVRRSEPGRAGWEGKRPTLWRLPLIAFLATGLLCLKYLDGRLSSDYRKSATDLARNSPSDCTSHLWAIDLVEFRREVDQKDDVALGRGLGVSSQIGGVFGDEACK